MAKSLCDEGGMTTQALAKAIFASDFKEGHEIHFEYWGADSKALFILFVELLLLGLDEVYGNATIDDMGQVEKVCRMMHRARIKPLVTLRLAEDTVPSLITNLGAISLQESNLPVQEYLFSFQISDTVYEVRFELMISSAQA